jgi:hypothetical protein
MDTRRLHRLLLILGFVIAQSLALVHATQHELAGGDSPLCETCAIAHAGGGLPSVAPAAPVLVFFDEAPAAARIVAVIPRLVHRANSRAPPIVLV